MCVSCRADTHSRLAVLTDEGVDASTGKSKKGSTAQLTSAFTRGLHAGAPLWVPAAGIAALVAGIVVAVVRTRKRGYAILHDVSTDGEGTSIDERTPLVALYGGAQA